MRKETQFLVKRVRKSKKKSHAPPKTVKERRVRKTCCECDRVIENKATRCKACYEKKLGIDGRVIVYPSYEELLKDVSEMTMVKVGQKYGVANTTVRKWLKKYKKQLGSTSA